MDRKEYKAYPGVIGVGLIFPWFLPYLAGLMAIIRMMVTGETNKTIIAFMFLILALAWSPLLFFWAMVERTSLILSEEGITHRALKAVNWNIFRPKAIETKVPWGSVRKINWAGAPNAAILIHTDQGEIKFWVIFHPRVNAEIMGEIINRTPHLRTGK